MRMNKKDAYLDLLKLLENLNEDNTKYAKNIFLDIVDGLLINDTINRKSVKMLETAFPKLIFDIPDLNRKA